MKKASVAVLTLLLVLLPDVDPAAAYDTEAESRLAQLINSERSQRGLRTLAVRGDVVSVARSWAAGMASRGTLAHNPNLRSQMPSDWIRIGENVGVGSTAGSLHQVAPLGRGVVYQVGSTLHRGPGDVWQRGAVSNAPAVAPQEAPEFHLSDRAYAALSRAIATCERPPGSALNERDEAAKLGMSRTPVRQAFHRLVLEGLVVTYPRRGAFVTLLDLRDIQDNLEVRQALELAAVRRVFREKLPLDVASMEGLLAEMRRAARENDPVRFLDADEQFHLSVAGAAGNTRALAALQRAWVHINRARHLRAPSKQTIAKTAKQHAAILETLRGGSLADAEHAVAGHVRTAVDLVGDLIREMPWAFVAHDRA